VRKIYILVLAILAFMAPGLAPAPPRPNEPATQATESEAAFLKNMQASLSTLKTLKARFVQQRKLALFADTLVSKGSFAFQPPDMLRWQLEVPYTSILVFRQGQVSKFELDRNKHLKKLQMGGAEVFGEVLRQIMVVLKGDFDALRKSYDIGTRLTAGGREVVLKPKSKAMAKYLLELRLAVDRATYRVSDVFIVESGGDEVRLSFSSQEENSELDEKLFDPYHPLP
jgi:outer membrane lipoprotein-sorting protein